MKTNFPTDSISWLASVRKKESFEIHFLQDDQPYFCYKVEPPKMLDLHSIKKNLMFNSGGAFPLPKIEISRDVEGGAFNYNFNLNFGRNFEDLSNQMEENMAISYLSTGKGREVLLNHFLTAKGFGFLHQPHPTLVPSLRSTKLTPKLILKIKG